MTGSPDDWRALLKVLCVAALTVDFNRSMRSEDRPTFDLGYRGDTGIVMVKAKILRPKFQIKVTD
jgi:hypothetical protein